MRMTPVEIEMKKASRSVSQPVGSEWSRVAKAKGLRAHRGCVWNETSSTHVQLARKKKIRRASFFSCMRGQRLYSSKGELASRNLKARVTLGGREKKIEHFIPASPNSFPSNSHLQKESRKVDALAFGRRNVLYGVRRNLRH
jgi:hypothetical protein